MRESGSVRKEVSFVVQKEYSGRLLCERCDAFVVALLFHALKEGYDIRSSVPISEDLHFNIVEHLLPPLVKNGGHDVRLFMEKAPSIPAGEGVGMGFSRVYSLYRAVERYDDHGVASQRLTHVCVEAEKARRIADAVGESGPSVIAYQSDLYEAFPDTPRDFHMAFVMLCMKKLWHCCHVVDENYSVADYSLNDYLNDESASYGLLLFSSLSTSRFEMYEEPVVRKEAAKAVTGEFVIKWIRKDKSESEARLVCGIDEVRFSEEGDEIASKEAFFSVPSEYSEYLVTERCDAYVLLLLRNALEKGFRIRSLVPMSEDLYYNIVGHFLPPLAVICGYRVSVVADTAPPLPPGKSVGTGLSCGVDSLHAILNLTKYSGGDHGLTHFCIYNVGAFDKIYDFYGVENARKKTYARAEAVASEVGIPLIETDSDVFEKFGGNYLFSHDFYSAFAVFCLKKLWRCYYYASEGVDYVTDFSIRHFLFRDSAEYEMLLFDCLSTPSMRILSEGATVTRFEKISRLADYPIARRHLFSCAFSGENCGRCEKCTRNLLSLDLLGKLDGFSDVYDIDFYRRNRVRYVAFLYNRRSDHYFKELYDLFYKGGDEDLLKIDGFMKLVRRFDALWEMGQQDADRKAVSLLSPYESTNYRAAIRMAKAYEAGRGVHKDLAKRRACLEFVADHYRKEVSEGFETSRVRLFDVLWKLDDPSRYDDMLQALEPLVEIERPQACIRLARMYMGGKGLARDPASAVEWMRKAPASMGNLALEYCGMLMATDSEPNHVEALGLCVKRFEETGDTEFCAMASRICLEGKGSVKDPGAAVEWMRKAYLVRPEDYSRRFLNLLLRSGRDLDCYEAVSVCFDCYENYGMPGACEIICDIYRHGRGVDKDMNAAVGWIRKAMELDPVKYAYKYGVVLDEAACPKYYVEAADMCREILERGGLPVYSAFLACLYRDGKGVEKDPCEAVRLMKAAFEWNPRWYVKEYVAILLGTGIDSDRGEAIRLVGGDFGLVGDPDQCAMIARSYRDGDVVGKDVDAAIGWMRKAAEADRGFTREYCELLLSTDDRERHAKASDEGPEFAAMAARMLRDGKGADRDAAGAVEWMRKAMGQDSGRYRSEFVGMLFGSGRDQDIAEAAALCKGSYDEVSDPEACVVLSKSFREGAGVGKDLLESVNWMRRAMRLDPDAYSDDYCKAVLDTGLGDPVEVMDICQSRYAATGRPSLAVTVAEMFRDGRGADKDAGKAAEWMGKAVFVDPPGNFSDYCRFMASLGEPYALEAVRRCESYYAETKDKAVCKVISDMYRTGTGVKKDVRKASEWVGRSWGIRSQAQRF